MNRRNHDRPASHYITMRGYHRDDNAISVRRECAHEGTKVLQNKGNLRSSREQLPVFRARRLSKHCPICTHATYERRVRMLYAMTTCRGTFESGISNIQLHSSFICAMFYSDE